MTSSNIPIIMPTIVVLRPFLTACEYHDTNTDIVCFIIIVFVYSTHGLD